MPSIGTAKISSAPGDSSLRHAKEHCGVTAIVYPGALPAMPMTTDSKSDSAPACSSVFTRLNFDTLP